jgi:ethanolamine utilization protein EutN
LLVQPLSPDDRPRGSPLLAVDSVGAGVGEKVLIVLEGRAAGEAIRRKAAPVDAAIIGIVDQVTVAHGSQE